MHSFQAQENRHKTTKRNAIPAEGITQEDTQMRGIFWKFILYSVILVPTL